MKHVKKFEGKLYEDEALSRTLNTISKFIWDKLDETFDDMYEYVACIIPESWEVWQNDDDDDDDDDLFTGLEPKSLTLLDFYPVENLNKDKLYIRFNFYLNSPDKVFGIEDIKKYGDFFTKISKKLKSLEKYGIKFEHMDIEGEGLTNVRFYLKDYFDRNKILFQDINK